MARIAGNVCNTYIHIDLIVDEISTSIENNTSTVTWSLVGYMGSGGTSSHWYSNNYHTINVNINGKSVYSLANTTQKAISIGTNATQSNPTVIASGTTTVPHNEDGTKSCACSFSVVYRYSSAFSWSGSGNVALTNIARATVPRLSVSSAKLGDKVTISLPRASESYTHKIAYEVKSLVSGLAGGGTSGTVTGTSYEWTVPTNFGQYFPSERSTTVTFTVTTYNGTKQVGTAQTATLKVEVPDYTPTISNVTISDSAGYYTTYGGFVQGKSKPTVNITASGAYNSTIILYLAKLEKGYNSELSPITTDVLLNSGTITATIKVVDSRSKVATTTQNLTVLPYAAPVIASFNAYRCKSATDSTADDMGEYIAVSHSTSVSSLNSKNTKTVTVQYRQAGATTWNTLSGSIFTASSDKRWEVKLTVTDKLESTIANREVSVAYTLLDFNASGKGMAIGKVSEADGLDVNMDAKFRKGIDVVNPDFPTVNLTRSGVPWTAGFKFNNSLGVLGAFGMAEVNGSLLRYASDLTTKYDVLDTGNYSSKLSAATQSAAGLMSAADKKKLDGVATGANAYSLPTATSSTLGGVKTTSTVTSNSGYTACPIISGVPYYKDTKVTVDSSMSTSSTNPVQNKVVQGQLPTSNQNATSGYIRFPSAKIQVAWIKKTITTTFNTKWGSIYETSTPTVIGNWAAAFSSVPVVSYNAYCNGDPADIGVNSFAAPTTTAAGSVYLNRATQLSTSASYTITAIAVGTYT